MLYSELETALNKLYREDKEEAEKVITQIVEEDSYQEMAEEDQILIEYYKKKDELPTCIRKAVIIACIYRFLHNPYVYGKNGKPEDLILRIPDELVEIDQEKNRVKIDYYGFARLIAKKFCVIRFSGAVYIYDGVRFTRVDKDIDSIILNALIQAGIPRTKRLSEYVREIRKILFCLCTITTYPFNKHTDLIPVQNGIIWIKENGETELLPHSPVFGFTYVLPVRYDPDADCPNIRAFLKSLVNDDESLEVLYEIPASCLTRTDRFQYAYFIYGTGSNGKSTYLNLITALLGEDNVSHVSLQDLCHSRFRVACLIDKLANIFPDLSTVHLLTAENFRALTGGDYITVERKFQDPFSFKNTARLIFSGNEFPPVREETDAFWRRWIVVKFPNKFSPNPKLFDKLTTPEELSGFLNEVLKRLPKILNCEPTIVADAKVEWIRNSDSLRAFEIDCIVKDPNSYVEKKELYEYYKQYCEIRGMKVASYNRFCRFMQKITTDKQIRIAGKATRVWVGIKVRLPEEDQEEEDTEEGGYDNITPLNDHSRLLNLLEYNDDESESSEDEEQEDSVEYTKIKLIKLPVGTDHIEFLGVDGKEYRLYLEQEAEVPSINAKPLLEWGYAIKVG